MNNKEKYTIPAASVVATWLDLCACRVKDKVVLQTVEQRFPHAVKDYSMTDWYAKLTQLERDGGDAIGTYVSAFKGQTAENIAVNMLEKNHIKASLFDSLTNPDNDIFGTLPNGEAIEYSVKCGSVSYISDCVERSSATNYIINSESFSSMKDTGLLEEYGRRGIHFLDGGYSDSALQNIGEKSFADILNAGDISKHIPYVALAFLIYREAVNVMKYLKGEKTKEELLIDMCCDTARVAAVSFGSYYGAKIGQKIGTMIAPGIGTIVGGVIGALFGGFIGSSAVEAARDKVKDNMGTTNQKCNKPVQSLS